MKELSVQSALETRDCAASLCIREAEPGSLYCREHEGRVNGKTWSRKGKTREEVIEAIQRFARDHGGTAPSRADFDGRTDVYVSTGAAERLFGSWSDAIVAAGFPRPTTVRRDAWTEEGAITKLQEVVARLGYVPSSERLAGLGLPGSGAFNRLFGSWADYVAAAGFERPTHRPSRSHSRPAAKRDVLPELPPPDAISPAAIEQWIEKLTAEAERFERRAQACRTIADGLSELRDTA